MKNYKKVYYKARMRKGESDTDYINKVYKKYKKWINEGHKEFVQAYPYSKTAKKNSKKYFKDTLKLVQREYPKKDLALQVSIAVKMTASDELEEKRKKDTMKKEFQSQLKDEGITPKRRNKQSKFISPYNEEAEYWEFEDESGTKYSVTRRKYPDKYGNWYEIIEV